MKKGHTSLLLVISLLLNAVLLYSLIQNKSTTNTPLSDEVQAENQATQPENIAYKSGEAYPLMRIVDGDTLTVGFNGKTEYVRLIGIDASEQNDPGGPECYATEATRHLRELAQAGTVLLFFDESQGNRDRHGRLLAYVELLDGLDLGEQMLRDGYVHEYTYNLPYTRQQTYRAAENEALEGQHGLWAEDSCAE